MDKENNQYKGILWHCEDIKGPCEPEQVSYLRKNIGHDAFKEIFFKDNGLEYILYLAEEFSMHFHIATHTEKTSTCKEKSDLIQFPLDGVIKGLYFEDKEGKVYAVAIPGTKHKEDIRLKIADFLGEDRSEVAENRIRLARREYLPLFIEHGTVHPFLNEQSIGSSKGKVNYIFFDRRFLEKRKLEGGQDDFSFTLPFYYPFDRNHKMSIQINYSNAHDILKFKFGNERVKAIDLV